MTRIITNVQFAEDKCETSSSHKHCEANYSEVQGQCALNKFVQRILVEMFICSKKKDPYFNHNDPASC